MDNLAQKLKGFDLAWWPTLLKNFQIEQIELARETDSFTASLQNLAKTLSLSEVSMCEEPTLP
jgi:hypothetical protein